MNESKLNPVFYVYSYGRTFYFYRAPENDIRLSFDKSSISEVKVFYKDHEALDAQLKELVRRVLITKEDVNSYRAGVLAGEEGATLAPDADGVSIAEIEAFMNEVIEQTLAKISKLDVKQLHIKAGLAKINAEAYLEWMTNCLPDNLDPEERQNILYAILIEHGQTFNKLDQERTKAYQDALKK